jgi:SAM-dependent methyltransferase
VQHSNSTVTLPQDIWKQTGPGYYTQIRRAQIVCGYLRNQGAIRVLDVGCAEGFITYRISESGRCVVGVDIHQACLREAKRRVGRCDFVRSSITNLPFEPDAFDAVCLLEVLEHLPSVIQKKGLSEIDRVLRPGGSLVVSVPYKESIRFIERDGNFVPDNEAGHLHSLDEKNVAALMPGSYVNVETQVMGAYVVISCSAPLRLLPLELWLPINDILARFKKGTWLIMKFVKPA